MFEIIEQWDRELLIWLQKLPISQFDAFWLTVTRIEVWIPLYALVFFLFIRFFGWKKGGVLIITVLLAFLTVYSITYFSKTVFERLRPGNQSELLPYLRLLLQPADFSFFSGHASSSMVVTTFVFLYLRQFSSWFLLLFVWPILFSLSRAVLAVHFPSDLLVGGTVGFVFGVLFYLLSKKTFRLTPKHSRNT